MPKLSRRDFIKGSGGAAVIPLMGASGGTQAFSLFSTEEVNSTATTLKYPVTKIGNIHKLTINQAVSFSYPDSQSPCALIKMGKEVLGGVGPDKDIVAYSILCTHMGCPTIYSPEEKVFKCPCHFSKFDCEKSGQMVIGQATENLPQILLSENSKTGDITAIGVNGLIYGRQANIL